MNKSKINKLQLKRQLYRIVFSVAFIALPTVPPSLAVPFRSPIPKHPLPEWFPERTQRGGTAAPRCVDDVRSYLHVTALVPEKEIGLTLSENPTFFVFVPSTSLEYKNRWHPTLGKFRLRNEQNNVLYQTTFQLTGNPGVISFQLPADDTSGNSGKRFRLEHDKTYIWEISVVCSSDEPSRNPVAGGMVRRVAPTTELTKALQQAAVQDYPAIYANAGIWYEALSTLAQQRRSHPQNYALTANWLSLLKSVNLEKIAQQPLLSCCQATELSTMSAQQGSDRLFAILQNGKIGFINREGKMIVPPQFTPTVGADHALLDAQRFKFSEGLANIRIGGKTGYIDTTGKIAIAPQFEYASSFSEGLAAVRVKDDKWGYIDQTGKMVIAPQLPKKGIPCSFSEGLAYIYIDGKYRFIDQQGKIAVTPEVDLGIGWAYFQEGLAAVLVKNGKWGFIDKTGKLAIPSRFDVALPFFDGIAIVLMKDETLWGLIDKTGNQVTLPQIEAIDFRFAEGLVAAKVKGGKWGFIDKTGKFVIASQFDQARAFSEGLAAVQVGNQWGYIDKTGKMVIPPQFREVDSFEGGLAPVAIGSNEWSYIDQTGKLVWTPR